MTKRTERIVALERDAERFAGKASALHWEAAALVVEELERGTKPAELAKAVGKTVGWVRNAAAASRQYGALDSARRPSWGDAVSGFGSSEERRKAERTKIPNDPDERVEVARKLLQDPKVAKALGRPSDEDRTGGERRDPVQSLETALRQTRVPLAESIATDLLDLADQIAGARFSDDERETIRTALDRCSTALLEESVR